MGVSHEDPGAKCVRHQEKQPGEGDRAYRDRKQLSILQQPLRPNESLCHTSERSRRESDRGRGVVVNNETDERVYVKFSEVGVGVNFGAKEYDLLFIIADKTAWERFLSGNIKFGSETSIDATDGVSGTSYAGATAIARGVQVYQLGKKGVAIEMTFKGGRISKYKELN